MSSSKAAQTPYPPNPRAWDEPRFVGVGSSTLQYLDMKFTSWDVIKEVEEKDCEEYCEDKGWCWNNREEENHFFIGPWRRPA